MAVSRSTLNLGHLNLHRDKEFSKEKLICKLSPPLCSLVVDCLNEKLVNDHFILPLLVDGELELALQQVGDGGVGLGGEGLATAPAQGDAGPGVVYILTPVGPPGLVEHRSLAAHVHVLRVGADLDSHGVAGAVTAHLHGEGFNPDALVGTRSRGRLSWPGCGRLGRGKS